MNDKELHYAIHTPSDDKESDSNFSLNTSPTVNDRKNTILIYQPPKQKTKTKAKSFLDGLKNNLRVLCPLKKRVPFLNKVWRRNQPFDDKLLNDEFEKEFC